MKLLVAPLSLRAGLPWHGHFVRDHPRGLGTRALKTGMVVLLGLWGVVPTGAAQEPAPFVRQRQLQAELWRKISLHPYLSRMSLESVEGLDPYLFLVQRTEGQATGRARIVAEQAVALLEPMRARFESELAVPLALEQREDASRLVVVLLASAEDFEECRRASIGSLHLEAQSTFDRNLAAVILYDDPASDRDPAERQRSAQHALVHALQQAWYGGTDEAPLRSWLFEGMAVFMARGSAAGASPSERKWIDETVADTAPPARRWATLRTLEELCAVDEPLGLQEFFRLRTSDERLLPTEDTWVPFYRQAALLYHFLHESDGGRLRPGLMKFDACAFAGDRGAAALERSFAPLELGELESAFLAWVVAERRTGAPTQEIDEPAVLGALARTAAGCVLVEEPRPVGRPQPEALSGLDDLTPDERFAWALVRILPDGMSSSLARLEGLLAGTLEADLRSRIEREQDRIEAWLRLRTAFLEKLASEQGLLGLSRAASQTKLRLRSFAQGQLLLEERSGHTRSVSAEEIDQLGLAYQIPKGTFADDWARYYPYVLQGDSRCKKLLQDDGGAAGALLADARSDYPGRVSVGSAVQHLQELLQAPPPDTAEGMDEQLESMRELLNESAELSLVQRNRDAVLRRTREVLMQRYELLPLDQRLAGRLECLGEGRVRMSYSFEDPLELDDFDAGGSSAGVGFPTLTSLDEPFRVTDNVLCARGHASMRTLFELGAPLVVNYEITYVQPEKPSSTTYFGLGLCDDGQGHFLWAVNLSLLQLVDLRRNEQVQGTDRLVFFNTPYDLQLRHDGDNLTLSREGKELLSLGVGTRHCGAVFVQVHSDPRVQLDDLVIEGELMPNTFDRLKQAWVDEEIQGF